MANNKEPWVNPNSCVDYDLVPQKGPSKMDLLVAFANHSESMTRVPSEPIRVRFLTPGREEGSAVKWFVRIEEMEHEDGGDESWNFRGYVSQTARWIFRGENKELKIEGYYNTRSRTGHIRIESFGTVPVSCADPSAKNQEGYRINLRKPSDPPQDQC